MKIIYITITVSNDFIQIRTVYIRYRIAQNFDGGKSDEFDERMLNSQNFSYQKFALRKFSVLI